MGFTVEALSVLLFLLPGFLASRIIGAIALRRAKRTAGETAIDALIYSSVIYILLEAVGCGVVVYDPTGKTVPRIDPELAWLPLVCAGLFALVYGASIQHDWHMGRLRWLRITGRTARASTWLDVFAAPRGGVVVNYEDGRRLTGWPDHYSDEYDEGLLYLRSPAWKVGNAWHPIKAEGILINVRDGVESITFLRGETDNA